ncbi:helix-turn-helix domain-containing protein [Vallitalea okinawensis]|uniref:helix-turn-helix domain-containing protein n=1 Tax=Vallitalea okinawensis TaxID=2078660 RepID=UPI000CFDB733|nr:helix-turn-helix domain-containing protein [Vallitalea okinawensis]
MRFSSGKSSFIQIILSLVLVSIIPICVIIFYLYPRVNDLVKSEALSRENSKLSDIRQSFDLEMEEFNKLPVVISQEPKLTNYALNREPYSRYLGVEEIKKYVSANLTVEKLLLWYEGQNYLVSDEGVHSREDFEEKYIDINDLNTGDIKKVYVKPTGEEQILFVLPGLKDSKVIIAVTAKTIANIASTDNLDGMLFILDKDNNLLFENRHADIVNIENIYYHSEENQTETLTYEGIEYLVLKEQSQVNSLHYIYLAPYGKIVNHINGENQMTVLFIVLIILAEAFLIYILASHNYKPVKQLLYSLVGDNYREYNENEFQMVQSHINKLMDDYKYVYKHNLIRDVINGKIKSVSAFNLKAKTFDLELNGPYFNVTMFRFARRDREQIDNIPGVDKIAFPLNSQVTGDFTYGFNENTVLFLSGSKNKNALDSLLQTIYDIVKLDNKYEIYIGKSKTYSDLIHMNDAYIEALSVVEYQIFNDEEGVMSYEKVPRMNTKKSYPLESMFYFRTMLLRNELTEANNEYRNLINIASYKQNSIMMTRMILYNLYRIIGEFSKKEIENTRKFYDKNTAVSDMIKILDDAYATINKHKITEDVTTENEYRKIEDILFYVNNHYNDDTLSLSVLTEVFNMTQSNLSHYFKSHTNFGFKEYLNQLRVDHSKELLRNDSMSIKEISVAVGFASTATFTRNFKQYIGMTPTQHREKLITD